MVKRKNVSGPAWVEVFLAALAVDGTVRAAMRAVGKTGTGLFYARRKTDAAFAAAWDACLHPHGKQSRSLAVATIQPRPGKPSSRKLFLEALSETSSVTQSARRAGLPLRAVYKLRRTDAGFAAKWRGALVEGYDLLEMELLGHFRNPRAERKMDVAAALRLLAAHRDTVARERALSEDDDEEAVLASIDRFIETMRARREANAALLIEHRRPIDQDGDRNGGGTDAAG